MRKILLEKFQIGLLRIFVIIAFQKQHLNSPRFQHSLHWQRCTGRGGEERSWSWPSPPVTIESPLTTNIHLRKMNLIINTAVKLNYNQRFLNVNFRRRRSGSLILSEYEWMCPLAPLSHSRHQLPVLEMGTRWWTNNENWYQVNKI